MPYLYVKYRLFNTINTKIKEDIEILNRDTYFGIP